ncbi:MAG: helix-turn-helix transcriptional regulator [Ignavibacteriae bacterium]|nr:helix-turn-helix transcriptional regulator [Ignavibacteriota bacterium]MCB9215701.1 helix-turn-helix transcriptional regulator [Ignavibacteria bacterium]
MTIGGRLKIFAKKRYGSTRSLAEACDINETQLSRYVNNINEPSFAVLMKLKEAGLSIDWLMSGNGTMDDIKKTGLVIDTTSPIGTYLGEKKLSDVFDLNDPHLSDHIVWMESALQSLKDLVERGDKPSDNAEK